MTNEKRAMIGSIITIGVIILSFLIRPIGEFFVKMIIGTLILTVGVFLLIIVYNAVYGIILDILDWMEERRNRQ